MTYASKDHSTSFATGFSTIRLTLLHPYPLLDHNSIPMNRFYVFLSKHFWMPSIEFDIWMRCCMHHSNTVHVRQVGGCCITYIYAAGWLAGCSSRNQPTKYSLYNSSDLLKGTVVVVDVVFPWMVLYLYSTLVVHFGLNIFSCFSSCCIWRVAFNDFVSFIACLFGLVCAPKSNWFHLKLIGIFVNFCLELIFATLFWCFGVFFCCNWVGMELESPVGCHVYSQSVSVLKPIHKTSRHRTKFKPPSCHAIGM